MGGGKGRRGDVGSGNRIGLDEAGLNSIGLSGIGWD